MGFLAFQNLQCAWLGARFRVWAGRAPRGEWAGPGRRSFLEKVALGSGLKGKEELGEDGQRGQRQESSRVQTSKGSGGPWALRSRSPHHRPRASLSPVSGSPLCVRRPREGRK